MVRVYFHKTREDALLPEYEYAGFDIKCGRNCTISGSGFQIVDFGLSVDIPQGYYGILMPHGPLMYDDFFVFSNFVAPGRGTPLCVRIWRQGTANSSVYVGGRPLAVLLIKKIRKRNVDRVINPYDWSTDAVTLPFSS